MTKTGWYPTSAFGLGLARGVWCHLQDLSTRFSLTPDQAGFGLNDFSFKVTTTASFVVAIFTFLVAPWHKLFICLHSKFFVVLCNRRGKLFKTVLKSRFAQFYCFFL
jgi:hypothetical protein